MNFLLCFSTITILAVLVNFSLAAETAKLHLNVNSTHLEKGVQKASGYYCNSFSDCSQFLGTFSSCNSHGRCVCDMGYEVRSGSTHCQKVSCSSMTDCTEKFGLFSSCSLGSCVCDYNYSYDLQLETCSRTRTIPIPSYYSCSSYSDCDRRFGTFSSCNFNGRCVCDMGYEEKATGLIGSGKCERRSCNSMSDCAIIYGFNSDCRFGSCLCDTGYSYDLQLETCSRTSTIPIPSHYNCSSYSDCDRHLGASSSCNSNGRCVCDMGYEEKATTSSSGTWANKCKRRSCSSMSDCTTKYGFNSHCSVGSCSCDTGYSYDLQLETCSRTSTTIPIPSHYSCSSYSDCDRHLGTYSSCNANRRCVCDMGYEERATTGSYGSKCQRRSCSLTTDCMTKYGTNSHCNNEGVCSCDAGYAYDLRLEQCSYGNYITGRYDYYGYSSGPNFGLIIGLPVTIIGFIIIIVAIVMVRRRRQQELAAAAARVVAMQRGGVVQQPATVVINRQQNPQHLQPVYYQQQQNPPPFNPTFTGYQPQQAPPQYQPPQYQPPQYQPPAPAPEVYPSVSSSGGQYPNPAQTHYKS